MPKKEVTNLDEEIVDDSGLQKVIGKINKQYGKNTVTTINSAEIQPVEVIPTGSLALDSALGVGGLPRGRLIELYGEQSSGKTNIALSTIAQAQKLGFKCFFIDAEYALDPQLAKGIGVNIDELYIVQPDSGEQALDITKQLVESNHFALGVIDSVAALVPQKELDGEIGDQHVGLQARMLTQGIRILTSIVSQTNTCLIFINQTRAKIGSVGWGPQVDTPGGKALKFGASVRLDVKAVGRIKDNKDNVIGNELKITVAKNKLAPPFRVADTNIIFGKGIDLVREVFNTAESNKVITKSGNTYMFEETKLGVGAEKSIEFLRENLELFEELKGKL